MNKILLIDDDVELTSMLKEFLVHEGFDVSVANDGVTGAQYVLLNQYHLVVLDVMMPQLNGIDTLKLIRKSSQIPVIMLTAKGDEADRFFGLELGADDYVPKPCTPRELTARIRAILRRTQSTNDQLPVTLEVGALRIRPEQRIAEWDNHLLNLTSVEYNLLEVLARNAGRIVSKETLSLLGLGRPLVKFDRSVDVHLSSIRQKVNEFSDGRNIIQTVYRMGYQLVKD
jgi:two-component system OmpR family response regulator